MDTNCNLIIQELADPAAVLRGTGFRENTGGY